MQLNIFSKRVASRSVTATNPLELVHLFQPPEGSEPPFQILYCKGTPESQEIDGAKDPDKLWKHCESILLNHAIASHKQQFPHFHRDGNTTTLSPQNLHDRAATLRILLREDGRFSGYKLLLTSYSIVVKTRMEDHYGWAEFENFIKIKVGTITDPDNQETAVFIANGDLHFDPKVVEEKTEFIVSDLTKRSTRFTVPLKEWGAGDYHLFNTDIGDSYEQIDAIILTKLGDAINNILTISPDAKILVIDHGCGNGRLIQKLKAQLSASQMKQIKIIGYDPNPIAHIYLQATKPDPRLTISYVETDTKGFPKKLSKMAGSPELAGITHLVHVDSGGPIHFQVVSYEDAQSNLEAILSLQALFPTIKEVHLMSTGKTPAYFCHEDFEKRGFETQQYGYSLFEGKDLFQLYHGVQRIEKRDGVA